MIAILLISLVVSSIGLLHYSHKEEMRKRKLDEMDRDPFDS